MSGACEACLRRAWLIARLAGHLEKARRQIDRVLALGDAELIAAVGGRNRDEIAGEHARFDAARAAAAGAGAGAGRGGR